MKPNPHIMLKKELVKYMTGRCRHHHTYAEHPNCWFEEQEKKPRIGFLDIEASNLVANYGIMLTYCIKVQGEDKIYEGIVSVEDLRSGEFDKKLCKQLVADMLKFDIIMGFYSTKYDIPFIRSRCLKWRVDFPIFKMIDHKDIYYMAKRLLKLNRSSLAVVTRFLGIPGKNNVMGDEWLEAIMCDGEKQAKAMAYIIDHNRRDVRITEQAYDRLKPFDRGIVKSI